MPLSDLMDYLVLWTELTFLILIYNMKKEYSPFPN